MSFQRTIQNLYEKEKIDINTFLFVTWYGRSFYEGIGNKLKIWREIIVANIDKAKYDSSLWKHGVVFKVVILEVDIVSIPLGSIYNSKGRLVLNPLNAVGNTYGLYSPRLRLTKDIEVLRTGLYSLLSNSTYPYYKALNDTELERVYNKAPYYLFSKGSTDYILPVHVVNSFFYYKNSRCVHHIVFNEVINMFDEPLITDNMTIVPYYGGFVDSENAKFLSKFLFLSSDNGINCLKRIPSELLVNSMNSNSNNRVYMQGGFPLPKEADLKVVGQYITSNREGGRSKFLIYGIIEFKPVQPLFKLHEYKLVNIEDKRSTGDDRPGEEKSYNAMQTIEVQGVRSFYSNPVNSSVPIKKENFNSTFFDESPSVQILEREHQIDFYTKRGIVVQEIEGYSKSYNDTCSKSRIGRSSMEILIDTDEYFIMFKDVISEIGKIDNYTTDLFKITLTYPCSKDVHPLTILCASIIYKDYHYYLLDYGIGKAIPIFRYNDATISMRYSDIEDLIMSLYHMNISWAKILKEQKKYKRHLVEGVYILANLDHPSNRKDYQECVKNLRINICTNISNDRSSKR